MAVLVEGISVVMKATAIIEKFPGGWANFEENPPNKTLCADSELVRVGFMSPDDVEAFINSLSTYGFRYIVDGKAIDLVVADQQRGLTVACDWAEVGRVVLDGDPQKKVAACRMAGSQVTQLVTPDGWCFKNSLSANFKFIKSGWVGEFMDFVRQEEGLDVFRDLVTGKEVFVGRTQTGQRGGPRD